MVARKDIFPVSSGGGIKGTWDVTPTVQIGAKAAVDTLVKATYDVQTDTLTKAVNTAGPVVPNGRINSASQWNTNFAFGITAPSIPQIGTDFYFVCGVTSNVATLEADIIALLSSSSPTANSLVICGFGTNGGAPVTGNLINLVNGVSGTTANGGATLSDGYTLNVYFRNNGASSRVYLIGSDGVNLQASYDASAVANSETIYPFIGQIFVDGSAIANVQLQLEYDVPTTIDQASGVTFSTLKEPDVVTQKTFPADTAVNDLYVASVGAYSKPLDTIKPYGVYVADKEIVQVTNVTGGQESFKVLRGATTEGSSVTTEYPVEGDDLDTYGFTVQQLEAANTATGQQNLFAKYLGNGLATLDSDAFSIRTASASEWNTLSFTRSFSSLDKLNRVEIRARLDEITQDKTLAAQTINITGGIGDTEVLIDSHVNGPYYGLTKRNPKTVINTVLPLFNHTTLPDAHYGIQTFVVKITFASVVGSLSPGDLCNAVYSGGTVNGLLYYESNNGSEYTFHYVNSASLNFEALNNTLTQITHSGGFSGTVDDYPNQVVFYARLNKALDRAVTDENFYFTGVTAYASAKPELSVVFARPADGDYYVEGNSFIEKYVEDRSAFTTALASQGFVQVGYDPRNSNILNSGSRNTKGELLTFIFFARLSDGAVVTLNLYYPLGVHGYTLDYSQPVAFDIDKVNESVSVVFVDSVQGETTITFTKADLLQYFTDSTTQSTISNTITFTTSGGSSATQWNLTHVFEPGTVSIFRLDEAANTYEEVDPATYTLTFGIDASTQVRFDSSYVEGAKHIASGLIQRPYFSGSYVAAYVYSSSSVENVTEALDKTFRVDDIYYVNVYQGPVPTESNLGATPFVRSQSTHAPTRQVYSETVKTYPSGVLITSSTKFDPTNPPVIFEASNLLMPVTKTGDYDGKKYVRGSYALWDGAELSPFPATPSIEVVDAIRTYDSLTSFTVALDGDWINKHTKVLRTGASESYSYISPTLTISRELLSEGDWICVALAHENFTNYRSDDLVLEIAELIGTTTPAVLFSGAAVQTGQRRTRDKFYKYYYDGTNLILTNPDRLEQNNYSYAPVKTAYPNYTDNFYGAQFARITNTYGALLYIDNADSQAKLTWMQLRLEGWTAVGTALTLGPDSSYNINTAIELISSNPYTLAIAQYGGGKNLEIYTGILGTSWEQVTLSSPVVYSNDAAPFPSIAAIDNNLFVLARDSTNGLLDLYSYNPDTFTISSLLSFNNTFYERCRLTSAERNTFFMLRRSAVNQLTIEKYVYDSTGSTPAEQLSVKATALITTTYAPHGVSYTHRITALNENEVVISYTSTSAPQSEIFVVRFNAGSNTNETLLQQYFECNVSSYGNFEAINGNEIVFPDNDTLKSLRFDSVFKSPFAV